MKRFWAGCLVCAIFGLSDRTSAGEPIASNAPRNSSSAKEPAVALGAPVAQTPRVRAQAPEPIYPSVPVYPAPPPVPPPTYSPVPPPYPPPVYNPPPPPPGGTGFNDWCNQVGDALNKNLACPGRKLFESDHAFDCFASPITNPFLFEDPRSLTELRPIFMVQSIPGSNPVFQGGNVSFFGTQARLALTEKWSVVINKLGGVWFSPDDASGLDSTSGFAEFWIGPKWTFVRNQNTNTLLALGATFQIPTGPSQVAQDTGSGSIVPYLSFAQGFGRSSYGSFNFMDTLGFAFSVDDERSEYFYNSMHLDYDIGNQHKIYPMLELNWFHYTQSGTARNLGQEGRDIANFGSEGVTGHDYLTLAAGLRYKFNEHAQFGIAAEFPLTNPRDIQEFRLTIDFILRY